MAKPTEHARARQLRKQGWPLRRIANELGVALSSVSLWVRDLASVMPEVAASPTAEIEVVEPGEMPLRRCGRCERDLP
jgi:hypothetical protein